MRVRAYANVSVCVYGLSGSVVVSMCVCVFALCVRTCVRACLRRDVESVLRLYACVCVCVCVRVCEPACERWHLCAWVCAWLNLGCVGTALGSESFAKERLRDAFVDIVTLPVEKAPKETKAHIDLLLCFLSPLPHPEALETALLPFTIPLEILQPFSKLKAILNYTSFAGRAADVNDSLVWLNRCKDQEAKAITSTGAGTKMLAFVREKLADQSKREASTMRFSELLKSTEANTELLVKIDAELATVSLEVVERSGLGSL